jgi:hypothetical protein
MILNPLWSCGWSIQNDDAPDSLAAAQVADGRLDACALAAAAGWFSAGRG